ncbi:MAG TPA: endopeptidase La [Phycisphaerales bacterium]|nr:endopeptidase La [Phycisphaerales bacterium]
MNERLFDDGLQPAQEPDDRAEFEAALQAESQRGPLVLPPEVGVLPIRNTVVFPGTVTPLAIGRRRSRRLIRDIVPHETVFVLVAQRRAEVEDPRPEDLYSVGTLASVLKVIHLPQGTVNIVVHSMARVRILEYVAQRPYLRARVEVLDVKVRRTKTLKALMVSVRGTAARVMALSPNIPEEAAGLLESISDPSGLADFLAATLNLPVHEKQALLEELDTTKRLQAVSVALAGQLDVLELSHKIHNQVRDSIDKSQREYFLQEELKAIQAELGQADHRTQELDALRDKILAAGLPEAVRTEALRELDRLSKTPAMSPDYAVVRTYLEWVCELPWSRGTTDTLDVSRSRRILNRDHYGLDKIKQRILEFLAVRKLNPHGKSPILCFVGPPGVGKTSLGQSIARAMGRKFIRISLGGIRDEADIRGHRRTYIGALPGRILQELRKCGSRNPVFMLDELDKIGQDFRGDPASALLEVLDPQQNDTFTDHYLDQPFDLSSVLFIGTANITDPIPPALLDRMEIIELPGYTEREKLQIAKRYLVRRQLGEHGLSGRQLTFRDEAIRTIIREYTREAGVRNLERTIAAVCRHAAMKIAEGTARSMTVNPARVRQILGAPRYERELAARTAVPGVAVALAYTSTGGEILFVEVVATPGKGQLTLTGQLGEVMKESVQAALSVVRANAERLGLEAEPLGKQDYHVHVPAGAVPKDGPSAGIAVFAALVSLLRQQPTRPDVALTGEITLQGLVLPVGGLKEKVLAAKRAGVRTVICPARNRRHIDELPREARTGVKFAYVNRAAEALRIALRPD